MTSEGYAKYNMMPLSGTLDLKKGDRVGVYLTQGSIYDIVQVHNTEFSGILLEEDLSF